MATDIQAICFDAVGTLIFPYPPAHEVYARVAARFGSRYSKEEIRRRFKESFSAEETKDWQSNLQTNEDRERQRWQDVVHSVLDDAADPVGCFRELYHHFGLPAAWKCHPEIEMVFPDLRRRGYDLGIASNYDHRLRTVLAGIGPLAGMDRVIISSEVGWRKPAKEFFQAVAEGFGLFPQQVLFVGDDIVNDIQGAKEAGFRTAHLQEGGSLAGVLDGILKTGD